MPSTIATAPQPTGSPALTKAQRLRSADLAAHPVPTGREEDWRFTPLAPLRALLDAVPQAAALDVVWTSLGGDVSKVAGDDLALGTVMVPGDRTSAVTAANCTEALIVRVPAETVDSRTDITLVGPGAEVVTYGHVLVDIGRHATATVVLDHQGSATVGTNVEVVVGDGAHLTLVTLHDWDDDAVHATAHAVRVGRDAHIRHVIVSLGGSVVRATVDVEYSGSGGNADLLGIFFADAGQHLEHRLFVDHALPHCRSNVEYKGALEGDPEQGLAGVARSVWIGDVLIRAAAVGTETFEINRNLVLSDNARADSVPNLEIETGEVVSAGHASATGRFDDEQLFYLQARGIPADVARRLVVRGFFADIVNRIGVPDVGERVLAALDEELGGNGQSDAGDGYDDDEHVEQVSQ